MVDNGGIQWQVDEFSDNLTNDTGTIFAYGQTNAGKTYTMKGSKQNPGVIPLAIQDIFSYIKQVSDDLQPQESLNWVF